MNQFPLFTHPADDGSDIQTRRLGDFERDLCLNMARIALESGKPIDEQTAAIIEAIGTDEFIVIATSHDGMGTRVHKPLIHTSARVAEIIARREVARAPREYDIFHGIGIVPIGPKFADGHGDLISCDFETPDGIKAKTLLVVNNILGSIVTGSLYIDENLKDGTIMLPRIRMQLPIKTFGRRKIGVTILDNSIESQEYVDDFSHRIGTEENLVKIIHYGNHPTLGDVA